MKKVRKTNLKGVVWGCGVGQGPLAQNPLLTTDASPRAVSFTSVLSSLNRGTRSISQIC